jgi:flagellar biosynthesis/type III secretory pathway protein FliH
MEIKNKTVEIHKQEAYEEGFEHGRFVTREAISGRQEYDTGLAITKALYQLRQQIAQEIEALCDCNNSALICVHRQAVRIARGK